MRNKLLLTALLITAAACGGSDTSTTTTSVATTEPPPTTTMAPTTTAPPAPTTTVASRTFVGADGVTTEITDISRIVSLNGDLTEIIWELGFGENVVAIDVTTTYPEPATELPVVGFGQQLAPEAVLAFQPTLVIGDEQVAPPETIEQLRAAGVPVVILETQTTLDGISTKIEQVAEILGAGEAGRALAARVDGEIEAARKLAAQAQDQPKVAFVYVRGPQTVLLFGNGMPTQSMIESANAVDTVAATGVFGAVPLTPEALAAAAPDVIVLPTSGLEALGGVEAFAELPGIEQTPAGANAAFLHYDEAYFFNLGPRAGKALADFVLDLHPELAES